MAWIDTVRNAIYEMLCAAFALDPTAQSSQNRFIPAYVEGMTNPQANSNMNVCYFAVSGDSDNKNFDYIMIDSVEAEKIRIRKTIPVSVLLTFYGPNADDDAEYLWSNLIADTGASSPRAVLRKAGIAFNGMPSRPVSVPEIEGAVWRRRCDVKIPLSIYNEQTQASGYVATPPDVTIVAE